MLDRILEPEVMDSAEEARDYDAMDHRAVNEVFVTDLLALRPGPESVLDVGTGTAQIPIELCCRAPGLHIIGIDMSEQMLTLGRHNVERAGLGPRVRLRLADAKKLPFESEAFDAVISNSIVHHLPEPGPALAEMVRVCRPGGVLFVRDLVRPADEAELKRLVELYAAGANAHQRQLFADSLHAALTLAEIRDLVQSAGFSADTVHASSDRHWTWAARK